MDGQGQKQTQGAPQAPGHVPHGHGAWDGVGTSSGLSEPGKLQAKPPALGVLRKPETSEAADPEGRKSCCRPEALSRWIFVSTWPKLAIAPNHTKGLRARQAIC